MNVALTNACNLNCPYCFAWQIRKEDSYWITDEQFANILNFLKVSNEREVRLIGGEPTLHPRFVQLLNKVINDDFFNAVLVFSNGTFNDDVAMALKMASFVKRVGVLINVNSPDVIGATVWERIERNLATISNSPVNITLGLNVYDYNQQFDFIFELARKYRVERVLRLSVVAPTHEEKNKTVFEYYKPYKEVVMKIYREARKEGLYVGPDCSFIPLCLFSKEELFELGANTPGIFDKIECKPVLDVLPDGTVIRCFGMPEMRTNIGSHKNAQEIFDYFRQEERAKPSMSGVECGSCPVYEFTRFGCGCKALRR